MFLCNFEITKNKKQYFLEVFTQVFSPFLNWNISFFLLSLVVPNVFCKLSPYLIHGLQIYVPSTGAFHFVDCFLFCAETF